MSIRSAANSTTASLDQRCHNHPATHQRPSDKLRAPQHSLKHRTGQRPKASMWRIATIRELYVLLRTFDATFSEESLDGFGDDEEALREAMAEQLQLVLEASAAFYCQTVLECDKELWSQVRASAIANFGMPADDDELKIADVSEQLGEAIIAVLMRDIMQFLNGPRAGLLQNIAGVQMIVCGILLNVFYNQCEEQVGVQRLVLYSLRALTNVPMWWAALEMYGPAPPKITPTQQKGRNRSLTVTAARSGRTEPNPCALKASDKRRMRSRAQLRTQQPPSFDLASVNESLEALSSKIVITDADDENISLCDDDDDDDDDDGHFLSLSSESACGANDPSRRGRSPPRANTASSFPNHWSPPRVDSGEDLALSMNEVADRLSSELGFRLPVRGIDESGDAMRTGSCSHTPTSSDHTRSARARGVTALLHSDALDLEDCDGEESPKSEVGLTLAAPNAINDAAEDRADSLRRHYAQLGVYRATCTLLIGVDTGSPQDMGTMAHAHRTMLSQQKGAADAHEGIRKSMSVETRDDDTDDAFGCTSRLDEEDCPCEDVLGEETSSVSALLSEVSAPSLQKHNEHTGTSSNDQSSLAPSLQPSRRSSFTGMSTCTSLASLSLTSIAQRKRSFSLLAEDDTYMGMQETPEGCVQVNYQEYAKMPARNKNASKPWGVTGNIVIARRNSV